MKICIEKICIEYYFNDAPVINPNTIKFKKLWSDFNMKYPTYKPYKTECIIYDDDIILSVSNYI